MARPVRVVVLGSGSWGTTVAGLAAQNTPPTLVWSRTAETAAEINDEHRNSRYLGDRELPADLRATDDLIAAAREADVLVVGVPSHAVRGGTLEQIADEVRAWVPIVSLAKGLEPGTRLRPTEVISQCLPGGHPVGLLAGPNIASEIADGLAAASVVAMQDESIASACNRCSRRRCSVSTATPMYSAANSAVSSRTSSRSRPAWRKDSASATTPARWCSRGGLAEMIRLGVAMGAQPRTFSGLTGDG